MAVTVSGKNFSQISGCESTSDGGTWTGFFDTQDGDNKKEGTYSLSGTAKTSGTNDSTFTPTSSVDLSGGKHLRCWMILTQGSLINTHAGGGIQIGISDGTNTGYYYVGGRDTYPGGWYNFVVDTSRAVDSGTKPTNMNAITSIIIRVSLTGTGKNVDNSWIDNLSVCDGLIAYGDDAGGYFDLEDIFAVENDPTNGGWGVLTKFGGVYYTTGSLEFGDGSGTNGCKFQSKSQVLVFESRLDDAGTTSLINSSLMGINVVDNGTGTTEFILGDAVGGRGIQGTTLRVQASGQPSRFYIDGATDTDVDNFKLYGSTIFGATTVEFPADATNVAIAGCSFEECGQVDPDTSEVRNCFFINTADADASLLWNNSIDIQDCFFIGNTTGAGVEMPSATGSPYTYTNLVFSGNTYDVYNSSGSAITISKTGTSDPTSYEGSAVTFVGASVTVYVKAVDTDGVEVQNARVFLKAKDGTGPFPFEETVTIVNSGTTATVTHTAHGMQNNDYVNIDLSASGSEKSHYQNDGVFQITVTGVNTYTYTMLSAPGSSPTGTIKATFVALTGLTDVNGEKSTTRVYASDQPVEGWIRKTPAYKTSKLFGAVDSIDGYSAIGVLVDD